MKITHLLGAAAIAAACCAPSHAAIVTHNSLTNFQNAAGATTLENFSNAALGISLNNYSGNFTGFKLTTVANGDYSGISNDEIAFQQAGAPFAGQKFFGWANGDGNNGPTTTFALTPGATAFGFNFFNLDGTDYYNVIVNGQTLFNFGYTTNGFLGFTANAGDTINSVVIQTSSFGGYVTIAGIDDVRVSVVNAVPEPTGLALLGIGLLGLAARRRQPRAD